MFKMEYSLKSIDNNYGALHSPNDTQRRILVILISFVNTKSFLIKG